MIERPVQPRPKGQSVPTFVAPPRPGPDRIAGQFVVLERLDPERHAQGIVAAAAGSDWVWDYLGYGPFADAQEWMQWAASAATGADPYFYALRPVLRNGTVGTALGQMSFLRIDPAQGAIELGHILITPQLQRTASATEAMILMIGWAMQAGYRRFEWKCDALNAPSRAAAIRLGFTFEGIFRQHMIYKGRNRDTAWYSIIDSEWPPLKQAYDAWLDPANFDDSGSQIKSLSALTALALPGRPRA